MKKKYNSIRIRSFGYIMKTAVTVVFILGSFVAIASNVSSLKIFKEIKKAEIIDEVNTLITLLGNNKLNSSVASTLVYNCLDDDDCDGVPNATDQCNGFNDLLDIDNDGVPDGCDKDDDNDGILDVIECSELVKNEAQNRGSGRTGIGTIDPNWNVQWISHPSDAQYAVGNNVLQAATVSGSMSPSYATAGNGSDWITFNFTNMPSGNTYNGLGNHTDADNDSVPDEEIVPINGTTHDGIVLSFTTTINITDTALVESIVGEVALSVDNLILGINVNSVPATSAPINNLGFNVIETITLDNGWKIGLNTVEILVESSGGLVSLLVEELNLSYQTCPNTDSDAFLDHRDLDSDNDGCTDAIEGNGNFTLSDILPSGELLGGVDASTGIPNTAGTGQATVSAYNATVTAEQCDDDKDTIINLNEICVGFNDLLDNDKDGVPDGCDLDDDNDGILDTEEQLCNNPSNLTFITHTFNDSSNRLKATQGDASITTNALDLVSGVNFSIATPNSGLRLPNISATNFNVAEIEGHYIEMATSTLDYNMLQLASFQYRFGANANNGNYKMTLIISHDNFVTSEVVMSDEFADPIKVNNVTTVGLKEAILLPNKQYQMRLYFYDDQGTGIAHIDDFSITAKTCSNTYDQDADGLLNVFDNDADNDGCPDALEGNGNFTLNDVDTNLQLIGGVDIKTGIPIRAGTGQNNISAYDTLVTGLNCDDDADDVINRFDICNGFDDALDNDEDGVPDGCDLDDDNDGILDENECIISEAQWITNYQTTADPTIIEGLANGVQITYSSSTPVNLAGSIYNYNEIPPEYDVPDTNPSIRNTLANTNTITFSKPVVNPLLLVTSLGSTVVSRSINFDQNFKILWSSSINRDARTQISGVEGIAVIQFTGVITTISFTNNSAESFSNYIIGLSTPVYCDTDGDGLINTFDNDSDADGCPDALEGTGNFILTDADTNLQLIGAVDTNTGIPISAGTGQSNISAYDSLTTGPNCDDDLDGVLNGLDICRNFDDTLDNDNDGVPDGCDLDDDNDGILDTSECSQQVTNEAQNLGSGSTGIGTTDPKWNVAWISNPYNIYYAPGNNVVKAAIVSGPAVASFASSSIGSEWISLDFTNTPVGNTANGVGTHVDADNDGISGERINSRTGETYDGVLLSFTTTVTIPETALLESIEGAIALSADNNILEININGIAGNKVPFTNPSSSNLATIPLDQGWKTGANTVEILVASSSGYVGLLVDEIYLSYKTCPNSDTDTLLDYRDVDSDNDSCPDALEGDGGFTLGTIDASDQLIGIINAATGVPNLAGAGQNNISAYNSAVTGSNCDDDKDTVINLNDVCNGFDDLQDTDNDTVPDGCDLDDDNDGILDTVECTGSVEDQSTGLESGTEPIGQLDANWKVTWVSVPTDTNFAPGNDGVTQQAIISGSLAGSWASPSAGSNWISYDFTALPVGNTTNAIGNHNDADNDGVIRETIKPDNGTGDRVKLVYTTNLIIPNDALLESVQSAISIALDDNLADFKINGINIIPKPAASFSTLTTINLAKGWKIGTNEIEITTTSGPNLTGLLVDKFTISYKTCPNPDNDALPNHLDSDSDNDSCPDALEGDGTIILADLNTNTTLSGAVDTRGVPNIVGSGQSSISAYDADITSKTCEDYFIKVPTPTITPFLCTSGNDRNNARISITLSDITGGSGTYTSIQLIDADDESVSSASGVFVVSDVPGGSYSIVVTDDLGNTGSTKVTIATFDVFESATVRLEQKLTCSNSGENISIKAVGSRTNNTAHPENYEYRQSTTTPFQDSASFTNLAAADYIFYVRNKTTGCIREVTHTVTDPNTFNIILNKVADAACFGDQGSVTLGITDDTYTAGFKWSIFNSNGTENDRSDDGDSLKEGNSTTSNATPVILLPVGSYLVEITQTEAPLCSKTTTFIIEGPDKEISPNLSQIALVNCNDFEGSILVEPTGGLSPYSLILTNSATTTRYTAANVTSTLFDNLQSGAYDISITDALGCTRTFKDEIQLIKPAANLNATVKIIYECSGNTLENKIEVSLEDRTERLYILYALDSQDPAEFRLKPDFSNISIGNHYLTMAHDNGCINTITFEVIDFDTLGVSAEQRNINQITAVTSGGKEPYTYKFNDDYNGTENTYFINETGTYNVTVTDANGCEVSTPIYMEFIDVDFPNFFTPDGDGLNDFWLPINISQYPNIFLKVYDRYGRYVYEYQDNKNGWDGIYLDTTLPTGDYWYVVKLNGEADDRQFIGHFTLYR